MRKMAEAEGGHRRRLEGRMNELGIPVPDPDGVKISPWMRLQARIAPIDRLLAAREAAEDDEVGDLYKRPTGDPDTDRLLRDIRKDERSHSLAVQDMRSGGDDRDPAPVAAPGAQARLDRILGRGAGAPRGGSRVSGAVYGADDGPAGGLGIGGGGSGATRGAGVGPTPRLAR